MSIPHPGFCLSFCPLVSLSFCLPVPLPVRPHVRLVRLIGYFVLLFSKGKTFSCWRPHAKFNTHKEFRVHRWNHDVLAQLKLMDACEIKDSTLRGDVKMGEALEAREASSEPGLSELWPKESAYTFRQKSVSRFTMTANGLKIGESLKGRILVDIWRDLHR